MIQTARGEGSAVMSSAKEPVPVAPSLAERATASGLRSYTTT